MKISKLILLACVWGSIVSCEDLLDPKLAHPIIIGGMHKS